MTLSESLEAINYQGANNPLTAVLLKEFTKAIELYKTDYPGTLKALDASSDAILYYTGINVNLRVIKPSVIGKVFFETHCVSVEPPVDVSINSVTNPLFMKAIEKGDVPRINQVLNGTIDYKNCKVSGFYSDIVFNIELTTKMLEGNIATDALVGFIMHELGHAWEMLVSVGATIATTSVVLGIEDFFGRDNSREEVERYVKSVNEQFGDIGLKTDADADTSIGSGVIKYYDIYGKFLRQDTMGKKGIQFNPRLTHEYLADVFANRWGMGISIAKALNDVTLRNTLVGALGGNNYIRGAFDLWKRYLQLYKVPASVFARYAKEATSPLNPSTAALLTVAQSLGYSALMEMLPKTHPSIKSRIDALIRDNISMLKTVNDSGTKDILLNDIAVLRQEMNNIYSFGDWTNVVGNAAKLLTRSYIDESARTNLNQRHNNTLYELTSRLETLA